MCNTIWEYPLTGDGKITSIFYLIINTTHILLNENHMKKKVILIYGNLEDLFCYYSNWLFFSCTYKPQGDEKYVFTQPLQNRQDVTQGEFVNLTWLDLLQKIEGLLQSIFIHTILYSFFKSRGWLFHDVKIKVIVKKRIIKFLLS